MNLGFRDSSVGKEPTCNAGGPGSIPGLGRSPREGIGYPLQYSWASLVAQLVKNLSAMWEAWIQSLGRKDLLEKKMATHSSILAWRIRMDRRAWWLQSSSSSVTQFCPTLCDPMDCIVHGILQARILEWVAFPFSRGSFPT